MNAGINDCGIAFADGLGLDPTLRRVGRWLETRRDAVAARLATLDEIGRRPSH